MTPKEMLEAIDTCLRLDDDFKLNEWEEEFVISIQARVSKNLPLSEKQLNRLEEIYDRT